MAVIEQDMVRRFIDKSFRRQPNRRPSGQPAQQSAVPSVTPTRSFGDIIREIQLKSKRL